MVIRGNTRGNGRQLADYLITQAENERIHILDVDGRENADDDYLRNTILSMDAMAELTKAKKGLYHAQINPAMGEDKNMDWYKAADILAAELGLEDQRRVIVLHEKKGRTHAHVVWERYDHELDKMRSDSFSRLQQDRARQRMEIEFGHKQTPRRNRHKPEMKASLNQLWHQTGTGAQFLAACRNNGYMIAQGVGRTPFIVVDEHGHSFNLVRQLSGVRLYDVRQRLRGYGLMTEKQAIVLMRKEKTEREGRESEKQKARPQPTNEQRFEQFKTNAEEQTTKAPEPKRQTQEERDQLFKDMMRNKSGITSEPGKEKNRSQSFAENKSEQKLSESDRIRQALKKQRETSRDHGHDRDAGIEPD
jgi:hypothetical protein